MSLRKRRGIWWLDFAGDTARLGAMPQFLGGSIALSRQGGAVEVVHEGGASQEQAVMAPGGGQSPV